MELLLAQLILPTVLETVLETDMPPTIPVLLTDLLPPMEHTVDTAALLGPTPPLLSSHLPLTPHS